MSTDHSTQTFLSRLANLGRVRSEKPAPSDSIPRPVFSEAQPEQPKMLEVQHPDGRMSQYPPTEHWDDWLEWDEMR